MKWKLSHIIFIKSISWLRVIYVTRFLLFPLTFNVVNVYVVTVNRKPWMHAREVCKALKHSKKL